MEWHDEGLEEGEECLKFWGGTLAPERPAAAAAHERKLRLGAFPALFKGEPEEQQLARADAAETCWGALSANIQVRLWCARPAVLSGRVRPCVLWAAAGVERQAAAVVPCNSWCLQTCSTFSSSRSSRSVPLTP